MDYEVRNYKANIFIFKISVIVILCSSVCIWSGALFEINGQPIKKSTDTNFNILIKIDSEVKSDQDKIKKQIVTLFDKELANSLTTEKIGVSFGNDSINNKKEDSILSQENQFDLIINFQISKFNPNTVIESSFIIKNDKISEGLPLNIQLQSFQFDSLRSNNFQELIDCFRMIYYINYTLNLNEEQRFEEAINGLVEINDEIYSPWLESIKYHFSGNIYLEESVRAKNFSLKHDDYLNQALSQFRKSIEKNPYYAQSYFALGYICAVEQLDFEKAEDYFKKAVNIDENNFEHNWNLALVYLENSKIELARNTLINFLKKNNQNLMDSKKNALNELLKGL